MSDISVNVTNAGAANVSVSSPATVNTTVGNGGSVSVSLGTVSPGNATVVSGTLTINSTTTLAPGSNATVTNNGTAYAAVLDFGIPAGATGPQGPAGANGTNGQNGITPTITASATTLAAGSSATVTATPSNNGANVALEFGIPRGDPGNSTGSSNLTLSDGTPSSLGTAVAGTSNLASRADHSHQMPAFDSLANLPTNFPSNIASVTGLQAALDGKQAAGNYVGSNDAVDGGIYDGYIPANTITITSQPSAQTASGGNATFSVAATTTGGTLAYQWEKQEGGTGGFNAIDGATSSTLSLSGLLATADDGDRYRVIVDATNAASVTSNSALLTVPANVITITTQPTSQTASGGAATFTAAATVAPAGTPTYQWQRSNDAGVNWANVAGATSASLALSGLTVEADGDARFRVIVSAVNAASVTSSAATLTVEANNTITITSQPSNQTASGGAATFSVSATSAPAGTPTYQWQKADFLPARSAAWAQRTLPAFAGNMVRATYGGGLFAAVGGASVAATSPDGMTWTQRSLPFANAYYTGVVYGNGRFLALAGSNRAATSTDGVTWSAQTLPAATSSSVAVFDGSRFVVFWSGGPLATSVDGIAWQTPTPFLPSNAATGVAYGAGVFVVISSQYSTVVTGTPGGTWSQRSIPVSSYWSAIAYGNGLFVIVDRGAGSGSSVYLTSPDGITWTQRSLPLSAEWRDITFGDGAFVVVSSGTPSTTLTSTDGLSWTQRSLPAASGWRAITFGGGQFLAISNSTLAATASPGLGSFANVSGATSSSLALSSLGAADNGDQYRAVVSAANASSVTSSPATLTVP